MHIRCGVATVSRLLKLIRLLKWWVSFAKETYHYRSLLQKSPKSLLQKSPQMISLFCERALSKRWYVAKETCHFKEPTPSGITWSPQFHFNWYVSFAKEPYKRDDILQKRPIILRSLLPVEYHDLLNSKCRSLLQNVVSFIGLFCKRDVSIKMKLRRYSIPSAIHMRPLIPLEILWGG